MAEAEQDKCTRCGSPLSSAVRGGLCPACLLACGLATNTIGYTGDSAGGAAAAWTPPTVEELAPLFPELDILALIGRGGMGAVYKAREQQLDRLVALKILPPGIGRGSLAEAFAQRFAHEAQAMARLGHHNIVTIHSFGKRAAGALAGVGELYFFIMEYVDGLSLRQLLDTGTVNPKEALAIVPQICDALQYAHDRGIVHRDIKPENILLNRAGQVKIADFGLAKLVGRGMGVSPMRPTGVSPVDGTAQGQDAHATPAAAGHEQPATNSQVTGAARQVMGTPQYMAPEQIDRPRDVDHRADIYSLGVVFYQMLTGELPAGKPGEFAGKFEPPSRKVLIDVRLDEVVLRALEREPQRRYQQASEVRTQVETIVATAPVGQPTVLPMREPSPPSLPVKEPPLMAPAASEARAAGLSHEICGLGWGLIAVPMLVELAAIVLLFLRNGMPWREVPDIWLPWTGIMLAVAAGTFAGFRAAGRSRSVLVRCGVAIGMLCLAIFAIGSTSPFRGDSLSLVPVAVQGVFCLIYAILLFAAGRQPNAAPRTPKLSRLALIGALWAQLPFIAAFLFFLADTPVQPGEQQGNISWMRLLALVVLALAAAAPFATTVCGAVAISQIRHSAGKLYGLGLAVFDALLFPLLVLDGLIGAAGYFGLYAFFVQVDANGMGRTAITLWLVALICLAIVVPLDWLIIRWAWRAARKPLLTPTHLPPGRPSKATWPATGLSAQPAGAVVAESRYCGLAIIAAVWAGLGLVGLLLLVTS